METQGNPTEILVSEALSSIESGRKTPKEALEQLAKTGLFVFHGTALTGIDELEPRQATNHGTNDGPPAVFAASDPEQAIFMGLANAVGRQLSDTPFKFGYKRRKEDLKTQYILTPEAVAFLAGHPETTSEVYVLNKSDFEFAERGYTSDSQLSP